MNKLKDKTLWQVVSVYKRVNSGTTKTYVNGPFKSRDLAERIAKRLDNEGASNLTLYITEMKLVEVDRVLFDPSTVEL